MFGKGNDSDTPVIIDFGSCRPESAEHGQGGTPGWNKGMLDKSSKENDFGTLALVRSYTDLVMSGVTVSSLYNHIWQKINGFQIH